MRASSVTDQSTVILMSFTHNPGSWVCLLMPYIGVYERYLIELPFNHTGVSELAARLSGERKSKHQETLKVP